MRGEGPSCDTSGPGLTSRAPGLWFFPFRGKPFLVVRNQAPGLCCEWANCPFLTASRETPYDAATNCDFFGPSASAFRAHRRSKNMALLRSAARFKHCWSPGDKQLGQRFDLLPRGGYFDRSRGFSIFSWGCLPLAYQFGDVS